MTFSFARSPVRFAHFARRGGLLVGAVLAASAVTGDDPWTSAAHLARYEDGLEPDPATTARHDERFALYRDTYRALRPVHRTMADSR